MKILVIGQSVVDNVITTKHKITQAGGIFYSILGLNSIVSKEDEITLISSVSKDSYNYFSDEYDKINNRFLNWSDIIPTVTLNIYDDKERDEQYDSINASLYINNNALKEYDGILLNMITGYDISLEQLKRMRYNFNGTIYLDVHSLARRVGENMKREFRVIPNFSEWTDYVDIIQANESEFNCLTDEENENDVARSILKSKTKLLIKTMGEKGTRVFSKDGEEFKSVFLSSEKIIRGSAVGCGDVFGSVFFYNYIKGESLNNVLYKANKAAAFSASCNDVKSMRNLRNEL